MSQNSFTGTNKRVGNQGVRAVIAELMQFRIEVTRKDELQQLGGWADSLNQLLAEGLNRVRHTLAMVTHESRPKDDKGNSATDSSAGQREREQERQVNAINEDLTLRENWQGSFPLSVDDVQMPASYQSELPYDFSGADPKYPQLNQVKYENVFLKQFVTVLDMTVRDLSNLASAKSGWTISQRESVMIHNHLETAFTILQTKGGNQNKPHIVDATDPESLTGKVGPTVVPPAITDPIPEATAAGQ